MKREQPQFWRPWHKVAQFVHLAGLLLVASLLPVSRDEAFLLAVNIAKLPSVPRQILKDIPRPPNSASRDD
jgi:hypothetical protein